MSTAIQGLLPEELATQLGCKLSEIRRVVSAVYRQNKRDLGSDMVQVSKFTRGQMTDNCHVGVLEILATQSSELDPFVKFALGTADGHAIETVRIPLEREGRYSVCVSSQVGCALGCTFCKTTQGGIVRSLAAWEIVEQVRIVRQSLPVGARVSSVVFMGMGEPLANLNAVIQSIRIMSDPSCMAIDQKAMTICTCGLPKGIARLQETGLRVRVGLSIGSAIPEQRRFLMPVENAFPLSESIDALVDYTRSTRQSQMLGYTLLSGVNCTSAHADALRELALDLGRRSGRMPRLSLIAYNPVGGSDPFRRASESESESFRLQLISAGFPVVRRYSGGSDIDAACGQLSARLSEPPQPPSARTTF
jgi:23S rRNA (adenine2503-C2)-methyltransferase